MDLSQRLIRMEQLVSVRCNGCLCDLLVDYLWGATWGSFALTTATNDFKVEQGRGCIRWLLNRLQQRTLLVIHWERCLTFVAPLVLTTILLDSQLYGISFYRFRNGCRILRTTVLMGCGKGANFAGQAIFLDVGCHPRSTTLTIRQSDFAHRWDVLWNIITVNTVPNW